MKKLEPSYTAGQECINGATTLENSLAISPMVTHRITTCPSNSIAIYIYISIEMKILSHNKHWSVILIVLFMTHKMWKQPKRLSAEQWINMWRICATERYSATERMEYWRLLQWGISPETIMLGYRSQAHMKKKKKHMGVSWRFSG